MTIRQHRIPNELEQALERAERAEDELVGYRNRATELAVEVERLGEDVRRLRELIREAADDPHATLTLSLNERMRAALGIVDVRDDGDFQ